MTTSIHSVQEAHSQTEQTVQPPKTLRTEAVAHDTVAISQEARQALTHSTTQTGGGANEPGINH